MLQGIELRGEMIRISHRDVTVDCHEMFAGNPLDAPIHDRNRIAGLLFMTFRVKRTYGTPRREDCTRILEDRHWPWGLTKAKTEVNVWLKDIAPSDTLQKWFAHNPFLWTEFNGGTSVKWMRRESLSPC